MGSISEQFNHLQLKLTYSLFSLWIESTFLLVDTTYFNLTKKQSLEGSGSSGVGEASAFWMASPLQLRKTATASCIAATRRSRSQSVLEGPGSGNSWLWHYLQQWDTSGYVLTPQYPLLPNILISPSSNYYLWFLYQFEY